MSATTKKYLIRDYRARVGDAQDAVMVSIRGVGGIDNNRIRVALAQKNVRITVFQNNLARKAFEGTGLAKLTEMMTGPSALAYGKSGATVVDVARELLKWAKDVEKLELRGAVLDGQFFEGKAGVEALSKFPTKDEALATDVTLILSPGRKLLGAVKGPGGRVMGIIKSVEQKLEKGEAISKIA